MRVLLLTSSKKSPSDFIKRMQAQGITVIIEPLKYKPYNGTGDDKNRFAVSYLEEVSAEVYTRHAEDIDLIQILVDRKDWQMAAAVKGVQWHQARNGYQMAAVSDYSKKFQDTMEHEMWHSFDNLCFIYLGLSLASILGVADFDNDIVHRRGKNGKYLNNYSDLYPKVMPWVLMATAKRREIMRLKNILSRLMAEVRAMKVAEKPTEIIEEPEETPMPTPKTRAQILYETAIACLGKDMSDRAPNELGCADSVNNISELAEGKEIGGGTSTYLLYAALNGSPRYKKVTTPVMGAIVISPSGYSKKGAKNGHVGIVGKNLSKDDGTLWIMSNDSFKGTWEANFTVASWKKYFGTKLGFPVEFFVPV